MNLPPPTAGLPAASLLRLIWLASPALPVGGFSYSEGLEAAIDAGLVKAEREVADWLVEQLHLSQARAEALNAGVLHTRESSELRLQTEQMGRSLTEWLRNQYADAPDALAQIEALAAMGPSYPVAFALACVLAGAPAPEALMAYAFGWSENMVQAAIKAVPLGQSAGQRILARLAGEIPTAVAHALAVDDDGRQSFSPMLAILSARHEVQYSRLFRS